MTARTLEQQFLTPSDEFTPIPFWFWNDALTKEELLRQIRDFEQKGVKGFVIHPRLGIPRSIAYLSDEYMSLVEAAVKEASERGMTVILYDEAMYPSGSAKGLVVEGNPEYASRGLKMAEFGSGERIALSAILESDDVLVSAQAVKKLADRTIDTKATVILEAKDNEIYFECADVEDWSVLLFIEAYSGGTIRGIHFGEDDGEPDAPASADLLNPMATRKFIQITYERYYEWVGKYFGNTITAMFTDEPDILGRGHRKGLQPWTSAFLEAYIEEGSKESDLPLLWLEGEDFSRIRRTYRKAVQKRLISSYYKPLSEWCELHGIALTGHPAGSEDIGLLELFHIPGQDVVWRWVAPEDGKALEGQHSTAAKCSSDSARHRKRRRNLNEVFGVCGKGGGWNLSAGDIKWYMDWLFVRGVNLLSPHAFYYSIDGSRRVNERPPDVGPNNIWWPHYNLFAEYVKRMSWLMTDNRNVTSIGVLCREDWLPWRIVKPLYENQREFNYLEERLLISSCIFEGGTVRIAENIYTILLVEDGNQLEEQTVQALSKFRAAGGIVISLHSEGLDDHLQFTYEISDVNGLIPILNRHLPQDITLQPASVHIRVSHVVKGGSHFFVLVNEGEQRYEGTITLCETGRAEKWDAWEGEILNAEVQSTDERGMHISLCLERRQSIIYRINTAEDLSPRINQAAPTVRSIRSLTDGWRVKAPPEFPVMPQRLGSWSSRKEFEFKSGTVQYHTTFEVDQVKQHARILLDLGEVHEIAEVWVNGQKAGVRMWQPYTLDIGAYLKTGRNELVIAVTNSLANSIDHDALPSGLIGPVVVTALI